MIKYQFGYTELRVQYGSAVPFSLSKEFFAAKSPKDMRLQQYQKMLLCVVDMPLFVRVLCGFVSKEHISADLQDERFMFNKLQPADLLELYGHIEAFLATILHTQDNDNYLPIDKADLGFLREYLTADNCAEFNYTNFSFLAQIIANTFIAVSDKSFREQWQTEGKNIFEVKGRKFYLPAKAIVELTEKAVSQKITKQQFDQTLNSLSGGTFGYYNTWDATTAIEFYSLSQNFNLIHNGTEISQDELNKDKKLAFEYSVAALFATLSREIKEVSANGMVKLMPQKEMNLQELQEHTTELINFFNQNLTMHEAHQCSFFFANSILPTKNFTDLLTNLHQSPKPKKANHKGKK